MREGCERRWRGRGGRREGGGMGGGKGEGWEEGRMRKEGEN